MKKYTQNKKSNASLIYYFEIVKLILLKYGGQLS